MKSTIKNLGVICVAFVVGLPINNARADSLDDITNDINNLPNVEEKVAYNLGEDKMFSLELEKQGFLDRVVTSDVLWGKKWAVCGDSFTNGVTKTLLQEGKYVGKRYVYPDLIVNRWNMEILDCFDDVKT